MLFASITSVKSFANTFVYFQQILVEFLSRNAVKQYLLQ